jgi:iron complex outermembrane receptor protein
LHTYQLDNETAFVNTYTGYDRGYKMEFGKSKKIEERIFFNANPNLSFIGGFSYEILDDLPLTGDLPKPFNFDQPADLQNQYYLGSNFIDQNGNDLSIQQDFFYLHYLNYGTYLQMQANLNSSLNLTAGIRYDINTRYGESVNPRLGLVWTPTEELTVKMLYGESLLSPSPRKSNSHFGAFFPVTDSLGNITGLGSNFFHLSNPDLQPEKLRSVEGSLRYVLSNNLIFTLNAYYTNIDNLINKFVQNTEVASFKGVEIGFIENSANEGTADIYGGTARLDAVYNLQNGLGLNFYAGYSFSDGKTDDGPLLFNARHHIKAGVELTHPRFVISPRMIYRSTSLGSILDDSGQPIGSDPFTIFNIFAKVNIFQKQNTSLSVFTKINNLFDTRYYNVFIGGAEGFPRVPQRPRVWTIGAKLNY